MLSLTRKEGQRIRIEVAPAVFIWIELGCAHEGFARIGIDAPREMRILREEVIERMEMEASATSFDAGIEETGEKS